MAYSFHNFEYPLYSTLVPNFYPVNLQHSSWKHVFSIRVENKVDLDQMASSEASWSGSTVFSKRDKSGISRTRVNLLYQARKLEEYIRIILNVRLGYKNLSFGDPCMASWGLRIGWQQLVILMGRFICTKTAMSYISFIPWILALNSYHAKSDIFYF